jgi:hypothetical protein
MGFSTFFMENFDQRQVDRDTLLKVFLLRVEGACGNEQLPRRTYNSLLAFS